MVEGPRAPLPDYVVPSSLCHTAICLPPPFHHFCPALLALKFPQTLSEPPAPLHHPYVHLKRVKSWLGWPILLSLSLVWLRLLPKVDASAWPRRQLIPGVLVLAFHRGQLTCQCCPPLGSPGCCNYLWHPQRLWGPYTQVTHWREAGGWRGGPGWRRRKEGRKGELLFSSSVTYYSLLASNPLLLTSCRKQDANI